MITDRNLAYLYVGNVTSGSVNTQKLDLDAMPNGSVAVVNIAGDLAVRGAALGATATYQIVNKLSDGTIVRSPSVRRSQVTSGGLFTYVAPTEQISYLGYNGATFTGIGAATLGENYIISLWMNNTKGVYSAEAEKKFISAVGTGSQPTLAADLVKSAHAVFNEPHSPSKSVVVERVGNVTARVAFGGAGVLSKFTKGSKRVTFHVVAALGASTNTVAKDAVIVVPTYKSNVFEITCVNAESNVVIDNVLYTAAAGAAVKDSSDNLALALGGSPVVASAVADGVDTVTVTYVDGYEGFPPATSLVTTISGGDTVPTLYNVEVGANVGAYIELDVPWEGPTGFAYTKNEEGRLAVATVDGGTYALKFSGLPQPFNPQVGYPVQVNFDVLTDSFGVLKEYKAQNASPGRGGWRGLAELEAYAQGNEVWARNSAYPTPNYRREIKKDVGYNVITLALQNTINNPATGTNVTSPFTFTIAIEAGIAAYDGLDNLLG